MRKARESRLWHDKASPSPYSRLDAWVRTLAARAQNEYTSRSKVERELKRFFGRRADHSRLDSYWLGADGIWLCVARFGLFLQQIQFIQHAPSPQPYGLSLWFGTALIVLGVAVNLLSAWHHLRLVRELNRGGPVPSRPSTQAVLVALFLALVGLAMAIYLVSVRSSVNLQSQDKEEVSMTPAVTTNGIINKPSSHSVDQTVEKLRSILQSKGVTLFALVDHSGEAAKVGMKMRPTKLLIFGSPKAGTPLMLAAPSSAIDLPLKLLIWEDAHSKVWISYNDPVYLQHRHGLPQELLQNITVVEALAEKAAAD